MEQTPIEQLISDLKTVGIKFDATKYLAAEKERDKQIADKAWDAAENRIDWEREKEGWSKEQPNKEQYLSSLK